MRVRRLSIYNFRGVSEGTVDFAGHTLLVGGNNVGKSTVCEALDLVLGPERVFRRPVIDEHDFHGGKYLDSDHVPVEVRIEVVLLDLSEEAERRFFGNLRRWNDETGSFIDEQEDALDHVDEEKTMWALPLSFIGRYDPVEDDFVGNTFFDHPVQGTEELDEESEAALGQGRSLFTRTHKRHCGFVFLRALRTGSRALSLQRGSLLDTVLKLAGAGANEMWQDTLERLRTLEPAIGEIDQLKTIRDEVRVRLGKFVGLAPGDESTAFFASDLTREHLREVVRLFIAAEPGQHPLPFGRLGTGSINLLVFALLTFIAELKGNKSVIFAMEEPEIALPPHTQRRLARFVLDNMGQSIVTSHSPYVIGQFEPSQIVMLDRAGTGLLSARQIDTKAVPAQKFRTQRHQFAEAILSRAVLVVEGSTEAALFPAASAVMDGDILGPSYTHFDMAGVTVFNANTDSLVPQYGPIFSDLGKLTFAFYDKPNAPLSAEAIAKLDRYTERWESPEKGIEALLVKETPIAVIRRFLVAVGERPDYPPVGTYNPAAPDDEARELALKVLKARKGEGYVYAALLIEQCEGGDELPGTIRTVLEAIHNALTPPAAPVGPTPAEAAPAEPA